MTVSLVHFTRLQLVLAPIAHCDGLDFYTGVVLLVTYRICKLFHTIADGLRDKKNSDEKYYLFRINWLYLYDKI